MIIGIPTEDGRLHHHFGGCNQFALVEVDLESKRAIRTSLVPAPEHQPGLFPGWLRGQGVEVVIAGGIGHRALAIFAHHGIAVLAGTAKAKVEALVAAYLAGQLTATPAGCEHHGHHHDHEHGHRHQQHPLSGVDHLGL